MPGMYIAEALGDLPWALQAIIRLGVAAALGALVGVERERHGRSAGLRTQALVGLGAALAMIVSLQFAVYFRQPAGVSNIQLDPARVAYGVMGGIGFLGAGAILRYGPGIRGLTTAASLWCTAAVGLATGFGLFEIAAAATGIVLFVLYGLSWVDRWIPSRWYKTLKLTVSGEAEDLIPHCTRLLKQSRIRVLDVEYSRNIEDDRHTVTLHLSSGVSSPEEVLQIAEKIPSVRRFSLH
jgi:putative Mg2+ transporter-C (MgtC) family protein